MCCKHCIDYKRGIQPTTSKEKRVEEMGESKFLEALTCRQIFVNIYIFVFIPTTRSFIWGMRARTRSFSADSKPSK
jgi:hypothetical protein